MRLRLLLLTALFALTARPAAAQVADTARRASNASSGASVSGTVRDTIARAPLAGAWVQLSSVNGAASFTRTVASDSTGRFAFADVPDGKYALGFFHALLDSLGTEPIYRGVVVKGRRSVRTDLTTPSQTMLKAAMCGPQLLPDTATGALLVGTVRDAGDGAPVAGAVVTSEWLEFTIRRNGAMEPRRERVRATSTANGMFVMCNLPGAGSVFLSASHAADSTDVIELHPPKSGLLRRELFLGAARTVTAGDSGPRADTLAPPVRAVHLGNGTLRGRVVGADGGRPLGGALVRIADGPQTRANERGEWTLAQAPGGTRTLEVRAIGYYPEVRPVDVIPGAAPLTIPLITFKAMLDTVRITVSRINDRSNGSFDERRRSGMGRYVTAEEIERRGGFWLSDVFRMMPGVQIQGTGIDKYVMVRSDFGGHCAPAVYIDGLYMWTPSALEIDAMVTPDRVRGIEVYTGAFTPMEYQRSLSGCGAILIWTK